MNQAMRVALSCLLPAVLGAQSPRNIPATVLAGFGGAQDEPATELVRVTQAVRTDDGHFVVVNAKPLEVRVYDARGRFERRLGRAGNGPGEFQFQAFLRHWPGDSVLAISSSTRRWMLFGLDGKLVREWGMAEGEPYPGTVILLGGAYVRASFAGTAYCRAGVIRRLAPGTGPLHEAIVDPAGRVWTRAVSSDAWRVSDAQGRTLGTVTLPGFTVTQMRANEVVGYRLDEDDFPHVEARRVGLPPGGPPVAECSSSVVGSDRAPELKASMRNAMTAAEAYYSRHRRYPRDMRELAGLLDMPQGLEGIFWSDAGSTGFSFQAREIASGFRCIVSVGDAIAGFPEGVIACGG